MSLDAILVRETIQNAVLTHGRGAHTRCSHRAGQHSTAVVELCSLATAKNECAWRRHYAF
jgi:hypothetical protein